MKKYLSQDIKVKAAREACKMVDDVLYMITALRIIYEMDFIQVSAKNYDFDDHTAYCVAEIAVEQAFE